MATLRTTGMGLAAAPIDIQDTLDMVDSNGNPIVYTLDYNSPVDLACHAGDVDPITGETIANCGGVGPVPIGQPPTCMPEDMLTYANGYWLCVPKSVVGASNNGGGSGVSKLILPLAIVAGVVLFMGRR